MNTCIAPEEIEAWELEAYLYGDAPARVVQHVARCPACQATLAEQHDFSQRLQHVLTRADCPSAETLMQHRWRQLPPGRAKELDTHLALCSACRSEYAAFAGPEPEPGPAQQLITTIRQGLIEQSLAQGRAWLEPLTQRWHEVQLYLGQLLAGANAQPAYALAGLMGEDVSSDKPVKFLGRFAPELANFELTLVVTPEPTQTGEPQCQLEVIVTRHGALGDYSGVAVTLTWGDDVRTGTTDSLGKAIFGHLPCEELPAMSLTVTLSD